MINPLDEMTYRLLVDAGISGDMRVLDIGCGSGNVSFLLATLLGKDAQIVAIDCSQEALEMAREDAADQQIANISFRQVDLDDMPDDLGMFDAIVGRRVLMYLPNPAKTISDLTKCLKADGIVAFQEHDATMTPGRISGFPLHDKVHHWIWETVRREGGSSHMGFDLWTLMTDAGIRVDKIRAEGIVMTPQFPHPLALIARSMLPRFIEHEVVTENELDIDTLELRLSEEMAKANSTYVTDMAFLVRGTKSYGRQFFANISIGD